MKGDLGAQGPAGLTRWVGVNGADGTVTSSDDASIHVQRYATGAYTVDFPGATSKCTALAGITNGFGIVRVRTAAPSSDGMIYQVDTLEHQIQGGNVVWTYTDESFQAILAC